MPGPTEDIEPWTSSYHQLDEPYPLRMFVTGSLPPAAQQCLRTTTDVDACLAAHSVEPLDSADVTFGFGVYEHQAAPVVLSGLGGNIESQALVTADGVEYLADRAVVAAARAARLVVPLPASDRRTILAVVSVDTPATETCARAVNPDPPGNAEEEAANQARFEQRCLATVELRVDGEPSREKHDWYFGEQQVLLPPGPAREVTVNVVKNDPRNVRYALVIWTERS